MATEAKAVAESDFDRHFPGGIWNHIQITLRILLFDIDRRRDDALDDSHHTSDQFDSTCRAKHVPGHRFRGTDHQSVVRVFAEGNFNSFRFRNIAEAGGGGVGIEIIDFRWIHSCRVSEPCQSRMLGHCHPVTGRSGGKHPR